MSFSIANIFSKLQSERPEAVSSTVGVDIGSSSVKVVELEQTDKALVLKTYGEIQLGPYASMPLGAAVSLDGEKQTEAVVDVMREAQVSTRHGALAMPLASSFMTVIPLAVGEDENIESRIPVEAKKYIPLPLNDVTLNWTELLQIGENTHMKEVMLAAIENKALASHRQLQQTIGMTGEASEIEAYSLVRALWKNDDTTIAIIDIGARITKLYIVRDGLLERIHRVAVGGAMITKRLGELLTVEFEDAENLKRFIVAGDEHERDAHRAMVSVIESPLQEFKRIIATYEIRSGQPMGRVLLTGGGANSVSLVPYATDIMNKEVAIGNPFAKVAFPAFMEDTLKNISPSFGVSLGAALRHFQYSE